jgi:hypothetical protein
MSIYNITHPNNYDLYSKTLTTGDVTIGTLEIVGDLPGPHASITSTQLYNAVIEQSTGAPNSLAGYDNAGTFANVEVSTGLSLSGNVLTATGSGSGNVTGTPPSAANTPAIYTDSSGLLIGSSSVTATTDTLLGYNGSSLTNITSGTNIVISAGVISATGSGTGDVNGPMSSVAFTPAQFQDTTGKLLSQPNVAPTANTLIGYDGLGAMANITQGTNISISSGVISASAPAGMGDVTGPASSTTGALVIFEDTTGKNIAEPLFSPMNNSLLGYDLTDAVANISICSGLSLSGGTLTATGSGSGDVSGPITSNANTPAIYENTTGKLLGNSSVLVENNTLIGYSGAGAMVNIAAGNGITISNGLISSPFTSVAYGLYQINMGQHLLSDVNTKLTFDTILRQNSVSLPIPTDIQVLATGIYLINISLSIEPPPFSNGRLQLGILQNGSTVLVNCYEMLNLPVIANFQMIQATYVVIAGNTDIFNIYCFNTGGANLAVQIAQCSFVLISSF